MKMNKIKQEDGDIRVADITIAQLSHGLYRSTATAFKELVNNAYDADATVVRIDTNYPEFDRVSCVDDGIGMSHEQFLRFFKEEGIGSCVKRKHGKDTTDIYDRPIIGRLGIGMLAIGQLCHSFQIESHYEDASGEGKAYRATIILLDDTIRDREDIIRNHDVEKKEVEVGKWKCNPIDYDKTKKGFRIYSSDVRKTFKDEMKSSIDPKDQRKISYRLSDLHSEFYDKSRSVRDCKAYLEAIWELAILCPLPYYENKEEYPIDSTSFTSKESKSGEFKRAIQFIRERQQRFLNDNFRVVFDGIELRRHIQLPTEKATIPKLYFIEFDGTVFGSRLKFSGYLFAQVPSAIKPLELNGVQVRLRGVGIGGYDSTLLRYYKEIGTIRIRWISGEILVDEGLESALNIDRDSFNEHDEHFKKLQSELHKKLDPLLNKINEIARERSEAKRDTKDVRLKESMRAAVAKQSKGKLKLLQRRLKKDAPIVTVNEDKGEIVLNTAARPLKKKKADMIIGSIMLAYHTAKRTTKTEEQRDEKFYQLVKEILGELV